MSRLSHVQIIKGHLYPIGSRTIVQMSKDRYLIYLPVDLNYIWKELHEKEVKVRVYIEIPPDDEEEDK